jgi:hypothetical protein
MSKLKKKLFEVLLRIVQCGSGLLYEAGIGRVTK